MDTRARPEFVVYPRKTRVEISQQTPAGDRQLRKKIVHRLRAFRDAQSAESLSSRPRKDKETRMRSKSYLEMNKAAIWRLVEGSERCC